MKINTIPLFSVLLLFISGLPLFAQHYRILDTVGTTLRRYTLEVPNNYTGAAPFGIILMIHSHNSCGTWESQRTGFHLYGAQDSFLTVYPEGDEAQFDTFDVRPESNRYWNKDPADFSFIRELIGDLKARYNIDTNRIYMAGHSQGSQMTDLAAQNLYTLIKGFAPVSGAATSITRNRSMIRIWSPQDNGVDDAFLWQTTTTWAAQANGCDTSSPTITTQNGYTMYTFNGCRTGLKVKAVRFTCVVSTTDFSEQWQSCHWWAFKPRYQFSSTELILNFFREAEGKPVTVQHPESAPAAFALSPNAPNPFNPRTTLSYQLPGTGELPVRLAVYDTKGKLQDVLVDAPQRPGRYSTTWNPQTHSSGVYVFELTAGPYKAARKGLLLK